MMGSRGQQQFLLPDPKIIVEFVHVPDKIPGRFSVRQHGCTDVSSADIDTAPRTCDLVAIRLQSDRKYSGFSGFNIDVLRGNLVAVVHYNYGMFSWAHSDRVASLADRVAIHEHIRL